MRSTIARFAMRRRGTVVAALVLVLALAGTAIAGTGRGADLELGVTNTINNYLTTLRGSFTGPMFQVTNTGTGRGIGITVAAGKAPIVVNSTAGKAVNLNADRVDGLTSSQLQRRVSGACTVGQSIRSIAVDGTVTCENDDGIVGVGVFAGSISSIAGSSTTWVFAGPTTTVTTTANQRLVADGEAALGLGGPGPQNFWYGLCYQPSSGGTVLSFYGAGAPIGEATETRSSWSAAQSIIPGAGTWNVGFCVQNYGGATAISDNDYSNGWVMIVNSSTSAASLAKSSIQER